jgi:hypothetical protein
VTLKHIALTALILFQGLSAYAASCPTGNTRTVEEMSSAMVDVFQKGELWTHPNPAYSDTFRIKWMHGSSAKDPIFVTDYRDEEGNRLLGPGKKAQRTIIVSAKSGKGYSGWLAIKATKAKATKAIASLTTTGQQEVIVQDGRFILIHLTNISFTESKGICQLNTTTNPKAKGSDGKYFLGILGAYQWAKPVSEL